MGDELLIDKKNSKQSLNFKSFKNKLFHRYKISVLFCFLLLVLLGTSLTFFYNYDGILSLSKSLSKDIFNDKNLDWTINMSSYGTESCIRLYDVDGDGLDDILFGAASVEELNYQNEIPKNPKQCDQNENKEFCKGYLIALRGIDGKILWQINTKSEIFELNCGIDINGDGHLDCLGSGRKTTFIAFDPVNGKIIWDASYKKEINGNWNIYNPLLVPYDFDNDGNNDIIISAGGNPAIPSDIHERESGIIFVVSSLTGSFIGNCLYIPDNKETYMSPVLHFQKQDSFWLLFGSGGETVPGNLYAISLTDLNDYIMSDLTNKNRLQSNFENSLKGKYRELNETKGLYSLYETHTKGVMVPPVLVDVNNDGINDILVSTFDGNLILFDGLTFDVIWSIEFECYETYTSPSPGYFNDDKILDFMFIQNFGTFDRYINSSVFIVNGLDGSILWELDSPRMEMSSPLTIKTTEQNRDVFFFRIQGIEYKSDNEVIQQVYHGIEPQQPPMNRFASIKRDTLDLNVTKKDCMSFLKSNSNKDETIIKQSYCENVTKENEMYLSTFGFVIDRTIQKAPYVVLQSKPSKIIYTFTDTDIQNANKQKKSIPKGATTCVVMEPMERNTGAIGYLSNKNDLDIVTIVTTAGMVKHDNFYVKILTDMKIYKQSLNSALNKKTIIDLKIQAVNSANEANNSVSIETLKFNEKQTWTAYMGYDSSSRFN